MTRTEAAHGPRRGRPEPAEPAEPAEIDQQFEIAGGQVAGHEHQRTGRGCQDALAWYAGAGALVAVVTDGCGSSRHSEVGARLGARLLVAALARRLGYGAGRAHALDATLFSAACGDALAHLRVLAQAMGGELAHTVAEHFLFTVVGAVITPAHAAVFAMGDGVLAINGDVRVIGPFPDNRPPYPAYALMGMDPAGSASGPLTFHQMRPTAEVESVLVATDGAAELLARSGAALPGRDEPAGTLDQFWTEDLYFRNPDAVRRRLWLMSRAQVSPDWAERRLRRHAGILGDDTSIISIRRRTRRTP